MSPQNRKRSGGRPRLQSRPGQRSGGQRRPGASGTRPAGDEDAVRAGDPAADEVEAGADERAGDDHVVVASAPPVTDEPVTDEADADALLELPEPAANVTAFWEGVGIDPVLVSLPAGTGLTLRCYLEVPAEADDEPAEGAPDDGAVNPIDGSPTVPDPVGGKPDVRRSGTIEGEDSAVEPRFLGRDGAVYLFGSAEALVAYVRSGATHPLTDAPGWSKVAGATDLDPTPELLNRYELDLVVDIARAGADGWGEQERQTLVLAGELARDAAAFCGLADVQAMLGPGSPLDALDDDLRKGGFLAKRRLRRYNPDQIALSWRRIIRELATVLQRR